MSVWKFLFSRWENECKCERLIDLFLGDINIWCPKCETIIVNLRAVGEREGERERERERDWSLFSAY